jgi:hypothetical protein
MHAGKGRAVAGSTSVALLHQLVDDVAVVVHIYVISVRSTIEDQVIIRLQLLHGSLLLLIAVHWKEEHRAYC